MNIHELAKRYAYALKESEAAESAEERLDRDYNDKFAAWEDRFRAENAALVTSLDAATSRLKAAQEREKALETELRAALTGDKVEELPAGVKQTREKMLRYDPALLATWAAKHAPFLLVVDTKALDSFINKLAVDKTDSFELPDYLAAWRMPLDIEMRYKPSISDSTLIKHAPETDPDATAPEQDTEPLVTDNGMIFDVVNEYSLPVGIKSLAEEDKVQKPNDLH